ncbi:2OG-Fe(II) oxygenase, partial [Thiolapillus sp.]
CHAQPDRQSHLFHGRYENLYIDRERMPSMRLLLNAAAQRAAAILGVSASQLKYGFWFNLMQPGRVTSLYSHDKDDELLSCVYYLDAPQGSGNLVLNLAEGRKTIVPENGMFVFLPPQLEHEVTENRRSSARLSLVINFGPAD